MTKKTQNGAQNMDFSLSILQICVFLVEFLPILTIKRSLSAAGIFHHFLQVLCEGVRLRCECHYAGQAGRHLSDDLLLTPTKIDLDRFQRWTWKHQFICYNSAKHMAHCEPYVRTLSIQIITFSVFTLWF